MSKKRVLITGAAGFLGSHLCDRFIKEGYYVIGMDNLITGDLRNIEHLFHLEDFEFYHHDVSKFIHAATKRLRATQAPTRSGQTAAVHERSSHSCD